MPWCHAMIPWCNGMVACHAEIKRFNVLPIFTSDNNIFHKEKQLFSDIRFLQCADFGKSLGQMFNIVMKPIWVRALRLIFSQVYITRPCLQFYRPPKFSRIFCFWEFRVSDFRFASFTGQILAWTEKIWNTKFSKRKKSRNFGRPAEL